MGYDVGFTQHRIRTGYCTDPTPSRRRLNSPGPLSDGTSADYCDVVIQPGLMWAASFLPGNGLVLPPQDWQGAATIDCRRITPFGAEDANSDVLAFFLLAFNAWHNGVNAPFRKSYYI